MNRRSVVENDINDEILYNNNVTTPDLNHSTVLSHDEYPNDDDCDDIQCTQPLPILNGVIAFVDVRTKNDNRSHGISCVLEQLGARVVEKFTNDVTHVIFKEGRKMTINKATKKGIHLVSVLWIDQCMKNERRVSEKFYPAIVPEHAKGTPVIIGRLKKLKSMQPNDFEDDIARSAETSKRRRKRMETMNQFHMCEKTPSCSPLPVLVQDTQPRSPHSSTSDWQTPVLLCVPDTPPSLREKLQEMQQAKQNGTPFSPFSRKDEPPIKKLFDEGFDDEEDPFEESKEDKVHEAVQSAIKTLEKEGHENSKNTFDKTKTNSLEDITQSPKSSVPETLDDLARLQTKTDKNENSNPISSSSPVLGAKRKRKLISAPVKPISFLVETTHSSSDQGGSDLIQSSQRSKELKNISRKENLKRTYNKRVSRVEKRKAETESSSPERMNKSKKLKKNNSKSTDSTEVLEKTNVDVSKRRRSIRLSGHSTNIHDNILKQRNHNSFMDQTVLSAEGNNSRFSTFDSSSRTKDGDASMSMFYGETTFASVSGLHPPRQSIDEFSVGKCKKGKKYVPSISDVQENGKENKTKFLKIKNFKKENAESSSSSDQSSSKWMSSNDEKCKINSVKLRRANSFVLEKSPDGPRIRPSLVMTRLHSDEQETVMSIIKKLTGFIIQDTVTDTTTHVVLGDARRSLNVVSGIARGCWLVNKDWVLQSHEAKQWLEEETFEATEKFPSCRITRLERQKEGFNYKSNLFSTVGQMCISCKCVPPRGSLVALVKLCGGQVTGSSARATIYIGEDSRPNAINLKPVWILDCITENKLLPYDNYFNDTARPKRETSPEY